MSNWGVDPSHIQNMLVEGAKKGDVTQVSEALRRGASINGTGERDVMSPLYAAALGGHIEVVKFLLDNGANIEVRLGYNNWTPIIAAAYGGQVAVIDLLVERGADIDAVGDGGTALDWAKKQGKEDAARALMKKREPKPVENPDEISFSRPLDNRTLQEIFNFRERERISLLRTSPGGTVEAMTREGFDSIENKETLRRAFDEYARKGGKIPEGEVFPVEWKKPAGVLRP